MRAPGLFPSCCVVLVCVVVAVPFGEAAVKGVENGAVGPAPGGGCSGVVALPICEGSGRAPSVLLLLLRALWPFWGRVPRPLVRV